MEAFCVTECDYKIPDSAVKRYISMVAHVTHGIKAKKTIAGPRRGWREKTSAKGVILSNQGEESLRGWRESHWLLWNSGSGRRREAIFIMCPKIKVNGNTVVRVSMRKHPLMCTQEESCRNLHRWRTWLYLHQRKMQLLQQSNQWLFSYFPFYRRQILH